MGVTVGVGVSVGVGVREARGVSVPVGVRVGQVLYGGRGVSVGSSPGSSGGKGGSGVSLGPTGGGGEVGPPGAELTTGALAERSAHKSKTAKMLRFRIVVLLSACPGWGGGSNRCGKGNWG